MFKWLTGIAVTLLAALGGYAWFLVPAVDTPSLGGTVSSHVMRVDNRDRSYLVYRPARVRPEMPLLFVLHGSMGDGQKIRRMTSFGFDVMADKHGFMVVYPEGFEGHWNDCRRQAGYSARELQIDDVKFLRRVSQAVSSGNVRPTSNFVVGFSNGGHMAFRLAFENPEWATAIAAIAANVPAGQNNACMTPRTTPSVLIMNGTDDPINPFGGGKVTLFGFGDRGRVMSSLDSIRYFIRLGNHSSAVKTFSHDQVEKVGDVQVLQWQTDDNRFQLLQVTGGGHTIPSRRGHMMRLLGSTNHDVEAAEVIWAFFSDVLAFSAAQAVASQ